MFDLDIEARSIIGDIEQNRLPKAMHALRKHSLIEIGAALLKHNIKIRGDEAVSKCFAQYVRALREESEVSLAMVEALNGAGAMFDKLDLFEELMADDGEGWNVDKNAARYFCDAVFAVLRFIDAMEGFRKRP
jgi:hypothetical protein